MSTKLQRNNYRPRRCRFSEREQIDRDSEAHSWHNRPFNPPIDPILGIGDTYVRVYTGLRTRGGRARIIGRDWLACIHATCSSKHARKTRFDRRARESQARRRRRQGDGSRITEALLLVLLLVLPPAHPPGRLPVSSRRPARDLEVTHDE